jgi:hypothetical protein
MAAILDIFGNPVRERAGMRGRPSFQPDEKDSNKIKMLLGLGWSNTRIANAICISPATLKRHFRAELKERDAMRDRLDARRMEIAMEQANSGNIAALKYLGELIDRNDRMDIERQVGATAAPDEKVGKKMIAQLRADQVDSDLMAELDEEAAQRNVRPN